MRENLSARRLSQGELELPETLYVRDVEDRVFQAIVLRCVSEIRGVELVQGGFFKNFWGREAFDSGVRIKQEHRNRSVSVRMQVNIAYGFPIPEKAEEIQTAVSEAITRLTGLHVSRIHVLFRGLIGERAEAAQKSPRVVEMRKNERAPCNINRSKL